MKWYVSGLLFLFFSQTDSFADVEKLKFANPPLFTHIDRRPERDIDYSLCLLSLKNSVSGELDQLGVISAPANKRCLSEEELNAQTDEQRAAEKSITRVFEPVAMTGSMDSVAEYKPEGKEKRLYKFSRVAGFFRLIKKSVEDKGLWDSFCLAQAFTVDSGEEDTTLILCDKESVKAPPGEKAKFTCPAIDVCVARAKKVEKPLAMGLSGTPSAGRNAGDSKQSGGVTGGSSGRTH